MSREKRATPWNNVFASFAASQGSGRLQRDLIRLYARECPKGFEELLYEYDAYTNEEGMQRIDEKLRPFYEGPLHPHKIEKRASYRRQGTRVLQDALAVAKYSTGIESEDRLRLQCGTLMLWKDVGNLLANIGRDKPPTDSYGITVSSYISQSLHFMFIEGEDAHPENSMYRTVARAAGVFRAAIEKHGGVALNGIVLEEQRWDDPIRMDTVLWEYSTQAYGVHLQHYPEHQQLMSDAFMDQLPPESLKPPFTVTSY